MTDKERIDSFWFAVKNSWDIESREYFEREAPKTGDWSPEAMAVHHMWKRDRKPAPALPLNSDIRKWAIEYGGSDEVKLAFWEGAKRMKEHAPDLREAVEDKPLEDKIITETIAYYRKQISGLNSLLFDADIKVCDLVLEIRKLNAAINK